MDSSNALEAKTAAKAIAEATATARPRWHEEGPSSADDAVKAWTRQQAEAWRKNNPALSPWRVVGAQALAGLVCCALVWAGTGGRGAAAWSALYGAAAVVVPSALLARGMTRGTRQAVAAAAAFMFWEMLKIGVAIAMLVIAAKVVVGVSWPALLATMVVCTKVNWVALLWRGRRTRESNLRGADSHRFAQAGATKGATRGATKNGS